MEKQKRIKILLLVLCLNAIVSVSFVRHPAFSPYAPSEVINRLKKVQPFSAAKNDSQTKGSISLCNKDLQRR